MPLIDPREFAKRWCVPESPRIDDTIPNVRLGSVRRFELVSQELG